MKKTLVLLSLLLLLVACSGQQQSAQSVQQSKEPYQFGAVLPLTGTNSFYAEFAKYGIELAVEDVNKAGGINGRQLQIIYEDSGGDKAKATSAAQKLIDVDDVDALLTVTTPMGGAIAPVAEASKMPFIYESATNSFAVNKTYVFKDYPDATEMCSLLMKQVKKDGHEKVALIGTNAEFTLLCKQGAQSVAPLTSFETYTGGETDYRTQFVKIQNSGSTAILLSIFAGDCPHAYKQIRELGLNVTIYAPFQGLACGSGDNTKANPDLLKGAYGADVAVNEESTDPAFVDFKTRLVARGWTTQITGSAVTYDSIRELAKAYEGCDNKLCVTDHLRNLNDYQGVSGTIGYHGDQIVERAVNLRKFDGSKWVVVQS